MRSVSGAKVFTEYWMRTYQWNALVCTIIWSKALDFKPCLLIIQCDQKSEINNDLNQ